MNVWVIDTTSNAGMDDLDDEDEDDEDEDADDEDPDEDDEDLDEDEDDADREEAGGRATAACTVLITGR